jgi:hypothetical protein
MRPSSGPGAQVWGGTTPVERDPAPGREPSELASVPLLRCRDQSAHEHRRRLERHQLHHRVPAAFGETNTHMPHSVP